MIYKNIVEKCFSPARWRQAVVCVSCMLALVWLLLGETGCRDDGGAIRIIGETQHQETTIEGTVETVTEEQSAVAATIFVHACGQVAVPGVYALPEGSRVWDVVEAAGGFLPEAAQEAVNLAMVVADGSKLTIPDREQATESGFRWYEADGRAWTIGGDTVGIYMGDSVGDGENGWGDARGLIDINRADVAALMTIPGIGQTRAEAIVSYRETQGPFGSIEEIMGVSGIKEGLYAKIKTYITVGG